MRIITRTAPQTQHSWQQILGESTRSLDELYQLLELDQQSISECARQATANFPILVPKPFLQQMTKGNPEDPLLLQVLASANEQDPLEGFTKDPLEESISNVRPGIIHKYQGRVLMMVATGCAVNCRYCFRRHFAYSDNRLSRQQRLESLGYISTNPDISEIILSGGDPLLLGDQALEDLVSGIEKIPHVRRLRIHSRLPVVIPQRLTESLSRLLSATRLRTSLVLHINHAQEISDLLRENLHRLGAHGITLLNQSVLLHRVNDQADTLTELSEALFDAGMLPYYLHTLDKVEGAGHFFISDQTAIELHRILQQRLPGYLVPKLVRELPDHRSKTLLY